MLHKKKRLHKLLMLRSKFRLEEERKGQDTSRVPEVQLHES